MKIKKNLSGIKIAQEVIRLRLSQLLINEIYKEKTFKIPIHLALGHEAIAIAVSENIKEKDFAVLSHRNIHYNLAKNTSINRLIDEYLLKEDGLARGQLGSMNLANKEEGLIYTSSILGNNLGVAAGLALAQKVKGSKGIVFVVTGDGAMEEGSFYETLLFLKSNGLSAFVIIENNFWSLATKINERRCEIDIKKFTAAFDMRYEELRGNNVYKYINKVHELKKYALENNASVCLEVYLSTLGSWLLKNEEYPAGKYVNYHAGIAPDTHFNEWPILEESEEDPIFVLQEDFDKKYLHEISSTLSNNLRKHLPRQ